MVRDLSAILQAEVILDTRALEDAGLDGEVPVTLEVRDIATQRAIELVLDALDLTAVIDDGFLLVTTKEKAEEMLVAKVYEVSDLVLYDLDDPSAGANYVPLVDTIQQTIAAETWNTVGGQGAIQPFEAAGIEAIVISQTASVHDKIEALLARLRQARHGEIRKARREPNEAMPFGQNPFGEGSTGPAPPSGPLPENADRDSLAQPQLQLACDVYAKLVVDDNRPRDENIVFSPYGIATAMALVSAGARGETAREFLAALHTDLPPERLHAAMAAQAKELPIGTFPASNLRLANGLWVDVRSAPLSEAFLESTRKFYKASVRVADLTASDTRKAINDQVLSETDGKIRDLFGPDAFDELTRLVLVNTLYFRGAWKTPFRRDETKLLPFHTPDGVINTPTMVLEDLFTASYACVDGIEMLEKNYGGTLRMRVLLPPAATDFAAFEKTISAENLSRWLATPTKRHVKIFLPKFNATTGRDLEDVLVSLGVKRAFDSQAADFSGISDKDGLYLQRWRHRAIIEVDEEGAVAAAATAVVGGFGGRILPAVPVFRADRPFVFLIHDARSGTILFMGRVVDPTK